MSMIQAGMIGVIGAMLAIQLKGSKAEYGIYVSVAVSIVLFVLISDRLGIFVRTVKELIAYAHLETRYQTIAGQIETFAKLTILALGMPVLTALLETVREFLS